MNNTIPFYFFLFSFLFFNSYSFAQNYGFLKFDIDADSAVLVMDYDINTLTTVSSGDSIRVISGSHWINLSTPLRGILKRNQYIYKDSTVTLRHSFNEKEPNNYQFQRNYAAKKYFDATLFILTDDDSRIYFDNTYYGKGFAIIDAPPYSSRKVTIRNDAYGSKSFTARAYQYLSTYDAYRKPDRIISKSLSFIPGASQFYKRNILKGTLFTAGSAGLLFAGISWSKHYRSEKDIYNEFVTSYNNASDEENAFRLGNLAEQQEGDVQQALIVRNVVWTTALAFYIYNIFDGMTSPPKNGYRSEKPISFYLDNQQLFSDHVQTVTLRLKL